MDSRNLKPSDIAAELQIEEQTLRNWRSAGVPLRRQEFVRLFMERWDEEHEIRPPAKGAFTLQVDQETFDHWNELALGEGKILTQWAIDSLNALAQEQEDLPRAAEDPEPYGDQEP